MLATCRQLHADLPPFVAQILRFMWEPSAQTYDTTRSSGGTGPIEAHRVQLGRDPARRDHRRFCEHIYDADRIAHQLGHHPTRHHRRGESFEAWRLYELEQLLASDAHIPRPRLGDMQRLLNLARVIQLQWTQTAHPVPEERRTCRHCHRSDLGARARGGLCGPCYDFRQDHKRLPSAIELRRYGDTGRWRVTA